MPTNQEFIQSLFEAMDENHREKLSKLQNLFQALMNEYEVEIQKENANNGKLLSLLNNAGKIDTIVLHALFNKIDPTIINSPLRFYIYDMGMINVYLNPDGYEQNSHIYASFQNLTTKEDVQGYLEVINFVNQTITSMNIFEDGELEQKTFESLNTPNSEGEEEVKRTETINVEIEDGVVIKM